MEQWPDSQLKNTIRFVCKLYRTGTTGVYDYSDNVTVTEMLKSIQPLICKRCNIDNFKLLHNDETIIDSDDSIKKIFIKNYINLIIKPDYMYSIPESIFYNNVSKQKSTRISYLIKLDAIRKIQKFLRKTTMKECPCCYEKCIINTKYYNCNHLICEDCFNKWNQRNDLCPTCREPVKEGYRINQQINQPINLSDIWNIFRDNINTNTDFHDDPYNINYDLLNTEPRDTNTHSNSNTTVPPIGRNNERIMNIFPESHSGGVVYRYTNNGIHNIINDIMEENMNNNYENNSDMIDNMINHIINGRLSNTNNSRILELVD